ncbi:MAG: PAS-domain containing protein, partial [Pseudomonadota bacterium]
MGHQSVVTGGAPMLTTSPATAISSGGDDANALRIELEALRYQNSKLKAINDVLMRRVELGWGNVSSAYSSFQAAAVLTEKMAVKTQKLEQTQSRLDEATQDLSRTRREKEATHQRLSDLLESVSDAIALFDEERKLILANSHFYEFWRDTGATIIAGETRLRDLTKLSIVHGIFDPHKMRVHRQTHGKGGQDTVFLMNDGRWLQMAERPTTDGGLAVVYTDITQVKVDEIRERERAVSHKTEVLLSTLENLPQGVTLINGENQLEAWNSRFLELLGIDQSVVNQGMDFRSLTATPDAPLHEMLGDFDPVDGQCELERALSPGLVVDVRSHPVAGGGYIITYTDVTERSHNAEALRESEQRLRLIADAMPALISYVNREVRYEFANQAFEDWFGTPSDQIEGAFLTDVWGEKEFENHRPYIEKALDGETVNFELEHLLPDSRRRISFKTYVPHRIADGSVMGFFTLEQDVTDKRRTSQALKYAYQHMEQRVFERTRELTDLNKTLQREIAERALVEQDLLAATQEAQQATESKVRFIAAAGHDLLQPLNAARLFTTALQDRTLHNGAGELVRSLSRSLDDVESLITMLVDISKLEAGVVEAVPDNFVIDELLDAL